MRGRRPPHPSPCPSPTRGEGTLVAPTRPGARALPKAFRAVAAALLLGGCAAPAIDDNFAYLQDFGKERFGAEAHWLRSDGERRAMEQEAARLLQQPLSQDDAVRIALGYSPAFQAMLAEAAAASAAATQSARLPNPLFTFERLTRSGDGRDVDIERTLGISLLDFLLLPARLQRAQFLQQRTRLQAAAALAQRVTDVRQAWVRAVAAQQMAAYYDEVRAAAEASAELARRMQSAGNFSRLQRAREQAFYAEALASQARARQEAQASREALVRLLGLEETRAAALSLPPRLPDLPAAPRDEAALARAALEQRLDVGLARSELDRTAKELGLTRVTSVVNGLEIAGRRNSATGEPTQRGYELELPLPLFDFGDALRAGGQARYLAAVNRTAQVAAGAASEVREAYGSYRTAHDLARHYRDEIVPLRKSIADEMLLQYNGMLVGVSSCWRNPARRSPASSRPSAPSGISGSPTPACRPRCWGCRRRPPRPRRSRRSRRARLPAAIERGSCDARRRVSRHSRARGNPRPPLKLPSRA